MPKSYKHILKHFKKRDPKIHAVMENLNFDEWIKPYKSTRGENNYFLALCRSIVGQQLSGKAASSIYKRFADSFGRKVINPKNVLGKTDQELRDRGLSWAKVKYIKSLAEHVHSGELNLSKLDKLSDEEIITELTKVKGIGNWTVEMFLIFTLGREDVFSFGDLGLKKGIEKVYKRKDPTIAQMERITKKWMPYRSYGTIALWHSLEQD